MCDVGGVLWKELKSDTLINWSYFFFKYCHQSVLNWLAGLKWFSPRGSKAAFTSKNRWDRTSLRGSGTGNPLTRGNLFFLRHKNVSNPLEMTHLIQFSVVTSRVCKSYSRCVFLWLYFLSFKILLESVSCFSYSGIVLFWVMGMAKFWRTKFGYRQRADQFLITVTCRFFGLRPPVSWFRFDLICLAIENATSADASL